MGMTSWPAVGTVSWDRGGRHLDRARQAMGRRARDRGWGRV